MSFVKGTITLNVIIEEGRLTHFEEWVAREFAPFSGKWVSAEYAEASPEEIPLKDLDLSPQPRNRIAALGVKTIADLLRLRRDELVMKARLLPGFIADIEEWLAEHGLPELGAYATFGDLDTTLDELVIGKHITSRCRNILKAEGLNTIRDLAIWKGTREHILNAINCGRATQREIFEVFEKLGRPLK